MDHTDSLGNGVGGGEILEYLKPGEYNLNSPYMNNALIRIYQIMPFIIALIVIIILIIMIRVIMNMYGVKSLKKGKGIINELDYMESVRRRDASIINRNKIIQILTKRVENSIFKSNRTNKEYIEYNLERAGVKIPGGSRYLKAEEWNAIIVGLSLCVVIVSLIVTVLFNYFIGMIMILSTIIIALTMPMMYIRSLVKVKDDEIRENFSDFYLMIHYVLIAGTKTPLVSIMKSYAKTTDSTEMQRMVDTCVHYMDTYGEYEGAKYISKAYREIPVMGKLMRLIRQANEGGEIEQELIGFRTELINEKKYSIQRRTEKLIKKARASFNLLMPILVQAILSAMSIYISDMGLIQTFV